MTETSQIDTHSAAREAEIRGQEIARKFKITNSFTLIQLGKLFNSMIEKDVVRQRNMLRALSLTSPEVGIIDTDKRHVISAIEAFMDEFHIETEVVEIQQLLNKPASPAA